MRATEATPVPSALPRVHAVLNGDTGFQAWIAVDADEGEPVLAFGGLRIAPTVDAGLVSALATCMSAKFRMHGVPMKGAKAGIRADAASGCQPEVASTFARGAAGLLTGQVIVGKDLGASDAFMDTCYAALGRAQLHLAHARGHLACPDKVRSLRGYRPHMTGLGVAWAADEALLWQGASARGARVIVQGAGRVGLGSAVRLSELGAVLIGISDKHRALVNPAGIPVEALLGAVDAQGTLLPDRVDAPFETLDRDALIGLDAEVLVLAADSRVVDERLALGLQARVVVEGANFPCTIAAEEALRARRRVLIPDVISSSSSAALVGHQIMAGNTLDPDEVWVGIERAIRAATREALAAAHGDETVREAFYRLHGTPDV